MEIDSIWELTCWQCGAFAEKLSVAAGHLQGVGQERAAISGISLLQNRKQNATFGWEFIVPAVFIPIVFFFLELDGVVAVRRRQREHVVGHLRGPRHQLRGVEGAQEIGEMISASNDGVLLIHVVVFDWRRLAPQGGGQRRRVKTNGDGHHQRNETSAGVNHL